MSEYADFLENESADSGYCRNCGLHIDDRCECSEEERESGTEALDNAIDAAIDRALDREYERELERA